jgi:hypothetical protein
LGVVVRIDGVVVKGIPSVSIGIQPGAEFAWSEEILKANPPRRAVVVVNEIVTNFDVAW